MERLAVYDEKELLEQMSRGEEHLFREVYHRYHQNIYSLGFFLTRSHTLAEDITQEIFVKIWVNREDLTNIIHFERWIKVLVRNCAYNYLSRMAREKRMLNHEMLKVTAEATLVEDALTDKEFATLLKNAIDKLPPQQKKIYTLSRHEGLKLEAIAQMMDISLNTVKNHLKAALSTIRLSLETHLVSLVSIILLFSFWHYL